MHLDEKDINDNLDTQIESLQKENKNLNDKIYKYDEKISKIETEKLSLTVKNQLIESQSILIKETQEKEKKLFEEVENLKREKIQLQSVIKKDNAQSKIMIDDLKKIKLENETNIAMIMSDKEKNEVEYKKNLENIKSDFTIQLQNKDEIISQMKSDFGNGEKLANGESLKLENQIAFLENENQDNSIQKTAEFSSLISLKKELETKLELLSCENQRLKEQQNISDEKLRDQIGELQANLIDQEEQITLLMPEK
ncbi:unnamed protein product [Brachionus calyciflorus]|uniref:Uncharacterized protein n=1 Tax=Brachionus calyciflorus TaxID=104777 RepID=A0A814KBK3_9BILA|nr:unnamed protein product [Brachionus calyciflorus]